jgi:pyruvate/2-oxoglutarate/acetoin dehydrogenase E1 component
MTEIAIDPRVVFVGQAVKFKGTAMSETLVDVPSDQLLEFPVEEDMQLGVCIGLALNGFIPISIFPRWNFLLLATNQIVNHLDKLKELTQMAVPPKVIVRTGIGSVNPLDPGPQHKGDFTEAFKLMAPNLNIVRLENPEQVIEEYKRAYERSDGVSTILVEVSDKLNG